ncbi:hypothetical protein [Candidatus Roseilinea sp. NK_OTU-006]|nr:hypothetical protein [Candidatus Roseilinea sp. NK_OTU-006]
MPGATTPWPFAQGKDGRLLDWRGFVSQCERNFFMGDLSRCDGPPCDPAR